MTQMKMGEVIKQEKVTYKDSSGKENVLITLVANKKCPKWYLKILQDSGIRVRQES